MIKKLLNIAICLIFLTPSTVQAQQEPYRVALMVPLYLDQVDDAFLDADPNNTLLEAKPFSFLQFYEGFMIAADSVVSGRGMNLDLKVYDVDKDPNKVEEVLSDPWLADADLIVGPFHSQPFDKVKEFATAYNIPIVNPITTRSVVVDNAPNVIKVMPSAEGQLDILANVIKRYYHSNNVFVVREDDNCDMQIVNRIKEVAKQNIDSCTYLSNRQLVKDLQNLQKKAKNRGTTIDLTNYKTDNVWLNVDVLNDNLDGETAFVNQVVTANYERDSLRFIKNYGSSIRNNLFIVYGDSKVFANEAVNKITKLVSSYPLTVIMLPNWSKFDDLFNDNLMKIKAIYFDAEYIDYEHIRTESFICKFRNSYGTEPLDKAYMGFDIGWYFLNGLNIFGDKMIENLPYYDIPLLHTQFRFVKKSENSGLENMFWNVYQFKSYNKVVLKTGYEN